VERAEGGAWRLVHGTSTLHLAGGAVLLAEGDEDEGDGDNDGDTPTAAAVAAADRLDLQ